jgi:hypothetical protein
MKRRRGVSPVLIDAVAEETQEQMLACYQVDL